MKKYVFKPYRAMFPQLFEKEKARIATKTQNASIEHVGSTAISNLGGKGIIDIAIAVKKEEMESHIFLLESLGYEYRPTFSTKERFYFIIYLPDTEEKERRYHIHLTYPESSVWKELIGFRDYLRSHKEAVEEYAKIKQEAAISANNEGEIYRKTKDPFIRKINSLNYSI